MKSITMPEFDTEEWRALRDEKLYAWLQDEAAVDYVVSVSGLCEVFDDLIDGDKEVTPEDIHRTLFVALVDLPANPFFHRHANALVPVHLTGIVAWLDANRLEKSENTNDRIFGYALRDQYMDCLLMAVCLTRGRETMLNLTAEIRHFFTAHESFEEYDAKLKARQA